MENNMVKGFHDLDQSQCLSFFDLLAFGNKRRGIGRGFGIKDSRGKSGDDEPAPGCIDSFGTGFEGCFLPGIIETLIGIQAEQFLL